MGLSDSNDYLLESMARERLKRYSKEKIEAWLDEQAQVNPEYGADLKRRIDRQIKFYYAVTKTRGNKMYKPEGDFMYYWKAGITKLGTAAFDLETDNYMEAMNLFELQLKDKDQLYDLLDVMSLGKQRLLCCMASIFNNVWGGDLAYEYGYCGTSNITQLDDEYKDIVLGLLYTYRGY